MSDPIYDCVIRGGTVATATETFKADVAISGETIEAIGRALPRGKREIDATGRFVLPGGIDSHAHIEQLSAAGIMNADTWESATISAAHLALLCVSRQCGGKSVPLSSQGAADVQSDL